MVYGLHAISAVQEVLSRESYRTTVCIGKSYTQEDTYICYVKRVLR